MMDAQAIRQLEPQLDQFLSQFVDCFGEETEHYGVAYLRGQLSDLERKNVERIALAADLCPRTLQEFLASYEWDHEAMRTRLHQIVVEQHADPNSIGIIDETSFPKKGSKTPGVQYRIREFQSGCRLDGTGAMSEIARFKYFRMTHGRRIRRHHAGAGAGEHCPIEAMSQSRHA